LCFEFACLPELPIEPWDKPLQDVCTETGFRMTQLKKLLADVDVGGMHTIINWWALPTLPLPLMVFRIRQRYHEIQNPKSKTKPNRLWMYGLLGVTQQ